LHFKRAGKMKILDAYETSKPNDLKSVSSGMKNNEYIFPAKSVTTLVIKRSEVKGKKELF
jgi:hypothetical protein